MKHRLTVNKVSGMATDSTSFHKSVFTVFAVHGESLPHNNCGTQYSHDKTENLVHITEVKYDCNQNTASSPPAKMKRYCAFSPLNSTDLPIPLFISHPAIITGRMNVIWLQPQSGRCMHRTMMPQSLMCPDHLN